MLANKVNFRIGADPEVLLVNEAGKFISSIGLIGGTKDMPRNMGHGFSIQEDNVVAEFNIPPCETATQFVRSIFTGLDILKDVVGRYSLTLKLQASAKFDLDQLINPQAHYFGCEPDLNCWTKKINPRPKTKDKTLRSCGGHIHLQSGADPWLLGMWMDALAGTRFVSIDDDKDRRLLYGRAGAIRIKSYPGIEYRVLSNKWLESEELIRLVYDLSKKACEVAEKGISISQNFGAKIRRAINNSDVELAKVVHHKALSLCS